VVITDKATARGSRPGRCRLWRLRTFCGWCCTSRSCDGDVSALGAGAGFGLTLIAQQDMLTYSNTMNYREALKQLNPGIILAKNIEIFGPSSATRSVG